MYTLLLEVTLNKMTAKQAMTWWQSLETEKIQFLEVIAPFIQLLESSIQPPGSLTPEGITIWNESLKSLWFEFLESDIQEAIHFFAVFTDTGFPANGDRERFLLYTVTTLSFVSTNSWFVECD